MKIAVFSGAGMSAESGISTFRDNDGLWEKYNVYDVATPEAWYKNQSLVLDFYNQRRKQLLEVKPNEAHLLLADLQKIHEVTIVTQNIDDLHERAGSDKVLHLHGELRKSRSTRDPNLVYPIKSWELKKGDFCEKGSQLRPHVVWFGEAVPMMAEAEPIIADCEVLIVIGTSLNVYPAAGLLYSIPVNVPIYVIDPSSMDISPYKNCVHIQKTASEGLKKLIHDLEFRTL